MTKQDANRVNAQQSTGPRTPEGKAASSRNASKHNLTGGSAFLPSEDRDAYEAHLKAVTDEHAPISEAGKFVVRQIADAMWRLQRLQRMEDELIASSENPFLDDDDKTMVRLERLQRYRQMIERSYFRFTQEWRKLIASDLTKEAGLAEQALQKDKEADDLEFQEILNRRMREGVEAVLGRKIDPDRS